MARRAKIKQRKYIKNKNSRRREVLWNSISFEKGKSLSDYPEEIILNILVRLPAASLNDLRRVCKNWLDIISSSYFIQCHLARVQPYLIEGDTLWNNPIRSVDVKDCKIRARKLDIGCAGKILATCNGLLLIEAYHLYGICISNPATKQLLRLPTCSKSPCDYYHLLHYVDSPHTRLDFYRFGYTPSTREYKVVHFFHDGFHQLCEILTLGSDSWRRIDISFLVLPLKFEDQLSLNGVLHWFVGYHYIMSMDVAQETFHQTPIPSCIRAYPYTSIYKTFYLKDIGGSPSLINRISSVKFEVWILKDFQIKEWIKLSNIDATARGLINLIPLLSLRNDEVIFKSRREGSGHLVLFTYDLKLQTMIQVKLYSRDRQISSMITHFDTLVSLKFKK